MEIEVISETENPLLERREVMVRIKHTGAATPLKSEIRTLVAAKLSADDDKMIVGSLNQSFGTSESLAKVKIYKTRKRAEQIENPHVIKKNTPEKIEEPAKKSETVPAAEPAAEKADAPEAKPTEEKKEEPKAEEKKSEAEKKKKAPKKAEKEPKKVEKAEKSAAKEKPAKDEKKQPKKTEEA